MQRAARRRVAHLQLRRGLRGHRLAQLRRQAHERRGRGGVCMHRRRRACGSRVARACSVRPVWVGASPDSLAAVTLQPMGDHTKEVWAAASACCLRSCMHGSSPASCSCCVCRPWVERASAMSASAAPLPASTPNELGDRCPWASTCCSCCSGWSGAAFSLGVAFWFDRVGCSSKACAGASSSSSSCPQDAWLPYCGSRLACGPAGHTECQQGAQRRQVNCGGHSTRACPPAHACRC